MGRLTHGHNLDARQDSAGPRARIVRALAAVLVLAVAASWFDGSCLAQVGAGLSDPGARPSSAPAVPSARPSKQAEQIAEPPADAPRKLRELARARVLARLGRDAEAQKLYLVLARQYPKDQDVLGDMAEHFLDRRDPSTALAWIREAADPGARLRRLEARACLEGGEPSLAASILNGLIKENPADASLHIDLASAYSEMGDPVLAAKAARRAVELDPDNMETRRYAQELASAYRPRVQASFQSYRQGGDSTITTSSVSGRAPLGDRLALNVRADSVYVTKRNTGQTFRGITTTRTDTQTVTTSETVTESDPDTGVTTTTVFTNTEEVQTQTDVFLGAVIQGGQPAIAQALNACRVSLLWLGPRGLELEGGLSAFTSDGSQYGQFAALRATPLKSARITLEASRNNPWYDPPEAAVRQGTYDQGRAFLEYIHQERTGFTLEGTATAYKIFDGQPYADRLALTAVLSRRILADPELWLAYSFSPAVLRYRQGPQSFLYATDTQVTLSRPISLATNEAIHQIAANLTWRPRPWLQAGLYAGFGQDLYRPEPFVFAAPSLVIKPWDFMEWESRAEYRNETRFIQGGGESLLLFTSVRVRM